MSECQLAVWNDSLQTENDEAPCEERCFVIDSGELASSFAGRCVVSPQADAGRIDELMVAGAEQVLLGESALQNSALVSEAIAHHGGKRVGIWSPVRLAGMSWGFDTTSNADFSVVAVTNPVPRWVMQLEDGTATDVDACWWAGEMIAAGCSTVLVSVAAPEDDDLLACAEMAELAAERFWLDTGSADIAELRFWVRYGKARQLVLPAGSDAEAVKTALARRLALEAGDTACSG